MHTVLDLFAGIGGFSLGLERVGDGYFKTGAFCEIDEAARKVLTKHWPDVKIYNDIKELTNEQLQADGIRPSVITGGFPCQDIAGQGGGAGIVHGHRSSLWKEMFRLCRNVQPEWVIVENVPLLRSKGLQVVIENFCEIGYVGEFHCLPASACCGAPHQRDRLWIIANPGRKPEGAAKSGPSYKPLDGDSEGERPEAGDGSRNLCANVARLDGHLREAIGRAPPWPVEPRVGRTVSDGLPGRMDRIRQLGNAVVPQIPQLIGEAIMEYEKNE